MKVLQGSRIMLKRFWNYQRLLSASIGVTNAKKHLKFDYIIIFIYMYIFSEMLKGGQTIVYPTTIALWGVYSIVNSQNKLFEIVPVSKIYSLINIYLFVFIINLLTMVGITVAFRALVLLMPSMDLTDINLLAINLRSLLVAACISTIIASILVPIFFIKHNFPRKILTISVVIIVTMALLLFKNILPTQIETGKISFLESIKIMPHYNEFLLILACACVVIIPISMFISYRLYKGKRCLIC
jgi:hypothetical protein